MTNLEPGISLYSEYYPNPHAKVRGTFIFINGSGSEHRVWKNKKLLNCAKNIGSVFLYNRNGIGKSSPDLQLSSKHPLTAKVVSDRLALLLQKLKINPPFIFVAHSHGAMYASYFSLQNPKLVKGLLLIDPIPKDCNFSPKILNRYKKGIEDLKSKTAVYLYKNYSGSDVETFYQIVGLNETKGLIKQLGDIAPAIPVTILSSTEMNKQQLCGKSWYESQKLWLNKNPLSTIIQVSSDHFIQLTKPELVCAKLRQLMSD
ncbi:MAG: alpha/beta hydrolase [Tatlockia sp.]|nr:alpha/beta hydrolase [Tatlockia sp.]